MTGGLSLSTIFIGLSASAGAVLLAAVAVTAVRSRRRREALIEGGHRGYGAIEGSGETWRYYNSFE